MVIPSGETVNQLVSRVVAPIQTPMPHPFDNPQSLCRFRCAYLNYPLRVMILAMMARHWPETN